MGGVIGLRVNSARVIEVVGPAGAGKTSLIQALQHREDNIISEIPLGKLYCAATMAGNALSWIRPFVAQRCRGRWFTWREMRSMIYLQGWHHWLCQRELNDEVVMFDHGPIYRLALLREFGPELTRSARFQSWWNSELRHWASRLELIIWLDAPDAILLQRINKRLESHQIKGKPDGQACGFLARYRASYDITMRKIQLENAVPVLKFDTGKKTLAEIIKNISVASEIETVTC